MFNEEEAPVVESYGEGDGGGVKTPAVVPATDPPEQPPALEPSALDNVASRPWLASMLADPDVKLEITEEELDALPLEAKRVLAALHRRGEQGRAMLDKEVSEARTARDQAAERERKALDAEANALKWAEDSGLTAFLEALKPKDSEAELDPATPEGMRALAREHFRQVGEEFMAAIRGVGEKRQQEAAKAEVDAKFAADQQTVIAYMDEHSSDFDDPALFEEIKALVERDKRGGTVEAIKDAHELAVARRLVAQMRRDKAADLATARERLQQGSRTRDAIPKLPAHLAGDDEAIAAWYRAHPDAAKRDLAKLSQENGKLSGRRGLTL
jgi:hypothetical protein